MNAIPRRNILGLNTAAELNIRKAMLAVENLGADPVLTDVVNLLGQAKNKLADWVDQENTSKEMYRMFKSMSHLEVRSHRYNPEECGACQEIQEFLNTHKEGFQQ